MAKTVFYSWQMDTPKKVGFDLVGDALQDALNDIHQGLEIEQPIRDVTLDRDTKNVAGQPPIVDTIFKKIDNASVFVPDLTFVGTRRDGTRAIQNPNVLIEYGYAVKSLSYNRLVAVMNTHFGAPTDETMPFDMKHLRRPIQFDVSPDASRAELVQVRKQLAKDFRAALSAVLLAHPVSSGAIPFVPRSAGQTSGRFRPQGPPLGFVYDPVNSSAASQSVSLTDGPVVWFRIYPVADPNRQWTFNELQTVGRSSLNDIRPFNWSGNMGFLRAQDGFGVRAIRGNNVDITDFVSFVFTTGEMWACAANIVGVAEYRGVKIIPPMIREFIYCLSGYASFLTKLGVSGPFKWQAGFENTQGLRIVTQGNFGEGGFSNPCLEQMIAVSGTYTQGQDPRVVLQPLIAKIYDSCGLAPPEAPNRSGSE